MKLITTTQQFEGLHKAIDRSRGKTVVVDRDALSALLRDHGNILAELQKLGVHSN